MKISLNTKSWTDHKRTIKTLYKLSLVYAIIGTINIAFFNTGTIFFNIINIYPITSHLIIHLSKRKYDADTRLNKQ